MQAAVDAFGGLDVLVNNASTAVSGNIETLDDDGLMERLNGKTLAYMRCCRAALPHLRKSWRGRVICIGGTAARHAGATALPSALGNSAIIAFVKQFSTTVAAQGITANVVHPPFTKTDRYPARRAARAKQLGVSEAEAEKSFVKPVPDRPPRRAVGHRADGALPRLAACIGDHGPEHRHRRRLDAGHFLLSSYEFDSCSADAGGPMTTDSISRRLSRWVVGLSYADIPPEVHDRARGVTLQALSSCLLGYGFPETKQAIRLVEDEEQDSTGNTTALVDGRTFSRAGAAFINSEMMFAGGKWDTFRMVTHPGCAILPAALMAAEATRSSGRDFLTGIVAGYEVMERLAADFVPTIMARGFHVGPVFNIFGAAAAVAKIMGLSAEQVHGALAQCVNLASGNLEGIRSGGRSVREGAAVRNALLAVGLARQGVPGGETVFEGEAGFYFAYAGNREGRLTHSFTGARAADLAAITGRLGERWVFLESCSIASIRLLVTTLPMST